jgi:hypothetical protein
MKKCILHGFQDLKVLIINFQSIKNKKPELDQKIGLFIVSTSTLRGGLFIVSTLRGGLFIVSTHRGGIFIVSTLRGGLFIVNTLRGGLFIVST